MTPEILIVDDHPMVRMGLIFMLRDRAGIESIREATTAEEAITQVRQKPPSVVLLDVRLPDMSGIDTCREIKRISPGTKVIMITSYTDEEAVFASIIAGANGYFYKRVAPQELIAAIEKVMNGESVIDSHFTGSVLKKLREDLKPDLDTTCTELTPKEQQILKLITLGKSNNQIARELYLSPRTIKNYTSRIYNKLDVNNRAEAAAFTVKQSWYNQDKD